MKSRFTTHRAFTTLAFAATAAVALACGSDSGTNPTGADLAGTWNLQTVNGQPMPFLLPATEGVDSTILTQLTLVLTATTYTVTPSVRIVVQGVAQTISEPSSGTYTVDGSTLSLHDLEGGSTVTATVSGNTLTATGIDCLGECAEGTDNNLTLVFKKQ